MAQHVVDLLEIVEADHQQCHFARRLFGGGDHRGQLHVKRVAVGEASQRIVFRQISDPFGFAFSHRYVAQDRAILKAVGAQPAGQTDLYRKHIAVLAEALEFQDQAARLL